MTDKILVTNCAALEKKYKNGVKALLAAVRDLIAADKGRGLTTQLVDISDQTKMKAFKGRAVTSPGNERQCKDAVDAIYASARPDYLVLVDGPDVVPHLTLDNPTPGDGDARVPSDLPYASDAPYTSRDAAKYAAVTRAVGRIPGVTGAGKPDFVVKQLKAAAAYKSRKRADYMDHFAVSAQVWEASTALSVENIFGSNAIKTCPPTGSSGVRKLLAPLSHFINCHGAEVDPHFYGQKGKDYPVAMDSDDVTAGAKRNTMIATECCYGAQLFDPAQAGNDLPISNSYLDAGAIAFLGSTTIAYGPAEGNGAADLLTQYFMINALAGSSFGRAFLEARQKFVLGQKMEDPVNVKTLAQFILLADPSLQSCQDVGPSAEADAKVINFRAARKTRRVALVAAGQSAADSSGFPGKKVLRPSRTLHNLVQKLARKRGFRARAQDTSSFHVIGGARYGLEMKARGVQEKVVLVVEHRPVPTKATRKKGKILPQTRILVAHAHDNLVTEITEYVRR
jgi:Peptidase family C25